MTKNDNLRDGERDEKRVADEERGTNEDVPRHDGGLDSVDRRGGRPSPQGFPVGQVRAVVYRFAGLGTELAAYALVFAGIGYAIDSFRGHDKAYATAFGTLVGFSYGMFRFVKQVQQGPR